MNTKLKLIIAVVAFGIGAASYSQTNRSNVQDGLSKELVVAATGGLFEKALKEAYFDPFEQETGIKVIPVAQNSTVGPLKVQVDAKNVKWDVVYLAPIDSEIAVADDLLQKINYNVVHADALRAGAKQPERLAALYSASVITWNSKIFQNIEGPKALFDLKKYPGKRAIRSSTPYGILEIALLADGVTRDALYPLDVERAFRKLDTIKDHIIFYTANEQGAQLFSSGQAAIGIGPNGRAFKAKKDGLNVDYTFNGGVTFVDYWVVPKGAKNPENAMKFLDFISRQKGQVVVGNAFGYGSNNPGADQLYSPEHQKDMPTFPANEKNLVQMDSAWWSQNLKPVFARWQSWMLN